MLCQLIKNESGFVISAELTLVLTIAVIGVIVGLSHVAMAVNQELTDVAEAIGALNQSYSFTGFRCCTPCTQTPGSCFVDNTDLCDNSQNSCTDITTCTCAAEGTHTATQGGKKW